MKFTRCIGLTLAALTGASVITSCADSQLDRAIERTNARCPIEVGEGVRLDSVWKAGGEVCYGYTVDTSVHSIPSLAERFRHPEAEARITERIRTDSRVSQYMDIVKANDMALRLIFSDSIGNRLEAPIRIDNL